jgi:glutathione S-transferase
MSPLSALPAFQPLCLFSVLLVLFMFLLGGLTANYRRLAKVVVNPEDVGVNPGSHVEVAEAPSTLRCKRAHLNAIENIPGFLALATIFTLAGGSTTAGWAYFGLYFASRVAHAICYLNELQPFRTISFFIGQLCLIGMSVQILMTAFGR